MNSKFLQFSVMLKDLKRDLFIGAPELPLKMDFSRCHYNSQLSSRNYSIKAVIKIVTSLEAFFVSDDRWLGNSCSVNFYVTVKTQLQAGTSRALKVRIM